MHIATPVLSFAPKKTGRCLGGNRVGGKKEEEEEGRRRKRRKRLTRQEDAWKRRG